ncbi:MAG: formate dehydrogenase accessory sulfurtransferase FdhD [Anaerolineae bacterium]|nr:formate dehydrogenase accessory sulfurtransferase FdhD [Anaerolineae bacterium]
MRGAKESGPPIAEKRVWMLENGRLQERTIAVVLEEPLALEINGRQAAVLMRLPGMEKELAVGFCLSEGLVERFEDILLVHHCGQGLPAPGEDSPEGEGLSGNRVQMRVRTEALREEARLEVIRLVRAGCGAVDIERAELPLQALEEGPQVDAQALLKMGEIIRREQPLHKLAGGVHAAALFHLDGTLVALCEDVGRHNAVDKAIGHCLLRHIPLRDKVLLCTGRLSYEMVTKAIRIGIPILASLSAPTALAVQLAEQFRLTIVGYLRGQRMRIYAHPQRIRT